MKIASVVVSTKPKSVGILGFDGVKSWDLVSPLETFVAADTHAETQSRRLYDASVIGVNGRSFVSETGVVIKAKHLLSSPLNLDTIVIPGGKGACGGETCRRLAHWFRNHAKAIRRIVTIGSGIYPVAQSGLLDGCKVATHWRIAQDVAARFPTLKVDLASSFIKDGAIYSCGGGTAAVEMVLAMIEEDYGTSIALPAARELVMRIRPFGDSDSGNDVSQFQYGPIDRLADLPAWISAHLVENLSIETLALRACVCPRHFGRIFKRCFEITPALYVERVRVDEARRRLKCTRNSVEHIARAVGFVHVDSFRRAFERHYKMSPLSYRKASQAATNRRDGPHLAAA
jgi:transcriptional regulator GlxA family with amidase domain